MKLITPCGRLSLNKLSVYGHGDLYYAVPSRQKSYQLVKADIVGMSSSAVTFSTPTVLCQAYKATIYKEELEHPTIPAHHSY